MKMTTLHEPFVMELQNLYDCETQLVDALQDMAQKANYAELRDAFEEHLEQTRGQVRRLEQVFASVGESVKAEKCHGIRGIIKEGEALAGKGGDPAAVDAALIASAQKAEHYEIATYGTVCSWAETMGHSQAAELLHQSLEEEKETDERLTELAERMVNQDAVRAAGGQGY